MGYDSTMLLLIPGILLSMWAQAKVTRTYSKFSQVGNMRGITGAQAAKMILDGAGLSGMPIEMVAGELTDHYDPRAKILRLSEGVYASDSIAAVGVAAHEVGHAIQDASNYAPMRVRGAIVPLASIGGNMGMMIVIAGLILGLPELVNIGIYAFAATVVFQLVTLPVEFNASNRALKILNTGILAPEEMQGAKQVLSAAALTYVAAALSAVLSLVRLFVLRDRRK